MKIITFYTNEKLLIKKAASGKREAQQWLYERHSPKMLSVCRQYIKDLQFAEDVMVQGFLKVFTHLNSFKHEGSFEGWIRKIMVRECITYLRKQQPIVFDGEMLDNQSQDYVSIGSELEVNEIQTLIDALPEGYKLVFGLYALEGYKHSEIAEMLQISESTSKSQLYKARKRLQEELRSLAAYGQIHTP
ncbi:RNA polymerase sigma factor [Sediminicola sp. 1XM1-17]|uniref:RNA polymerase sigma factor n=1 Tax=Sediminicola sp. 1XM1-17 TaxID=3127702 RepID=UPI003076BF4C